jgi:hypothetical protein
MEDPVADVGKQTPVGNVQVDAFCAHCNYNLFSQVVSRDERLGILVCRCPECGQFTAAGSVTTANQKLSQRLATGALIIYIGFLLLVSAIAAGFLAGTQGEYLDDRYGELTAAANAVFSTWEELVLGAVAGAVFGGFMATFCWHWRRGWRYLLVVTPALLSILVWNIWRDNGYSTNPKPAFAAWGMSVLAIVVGLQTICIFVGELVGRPIARIVLQVLLPARLRQYLSFLWFIDGKSPPAPQVPAPGSRRI